MKPGDIVLISLPQVGGGPPKLRPALVLAALPGPFQDILICGISTDLQQVQANWDEVVRPGAPDFPGSGLHRASSIRLSYLHAASRTEVTGVIGQIESSLLERLLSHLADYLRP
ncbi:MAG: type II toxin-antitoxin system PemK/MazF family toxin [Planctomycetes bacterium]|nr:type II toxin-antitoxin system PemK/MazF family toxin [Planctomycetota bacterium]